MAYERPTRTSTAYLLRLVQPPPSTAKYKNSTLRVPRRNKLSFNEETEK